jgi:hypothetical protein
LVVAAKIPRWWLELASLWVVVGQPAWSTNGVAVGTGDGLGFEKDAMP